jgi:hypothetical protein
MEKGLRPYSIQFTTGKGIHARFGRCFPLIAEPAFNDPAQRAGNPPQMIVLSVCPYTNAIRPRFMH